MYLEHWPLNIKPQAVNVVEVDLQQNTVYSFPLSVVDKGVLCEEVQP